MSRDNVKVIEKDLGWNRIVKSLRETKRRGRVKVGVQTGEQHKPSGRGSKPKKVADLVLVAAVNEFGCPEKNIPARSFIRATVDMRRTRSSEELCNCRCRGIN